MRTIDIVIIVLYLMGIFAVGFFARKEIRNVDDYLTAHERFSSFALVGTIMASLIGAGMVMGVVGNIYKYGSGIIWNYVGFAVGLFVFGRFFVAGLRKTGKRTMAEIIAGKFGRLPRFISGAVAVIYTFSIMIIGVTGMARLLTYVFGTGISIVPVTVISVLVAVGLTALGGLYSVVWTDVIQFVIMLLVIIVISPVIAINKAGSLGAINAALSNVGGSLLDPAKNVPGSYISLCLLTMFLAVPGDPTVPQRALAGKTVRITEKAFYISGLTALLFGAAITVVGGGAVALMPDIASEYGTTEAALPVFIIKFFPPAMAGLGISAILAAIISTITSMLLVGTTHLVYDMGQSLFPSVPDEKFQKIISPATVVLGIIVIWLSLGVESIGSVLYFAFSLCGAAFLFPMLAVLYWEKLSRWGVTLGVLGGALTVLVMYALNIMGPGGDPVYMGLVVSLLFTWFPSLMENRLKKQ